MRNPLNKRFPKEFKKNAGRYICMLALLLITIVVGSAFIIVMDGAKESLDAAEISCKIEDGYVEVYETLDASALEALEKLELNVYKNFYLCDYEFDGDAKVFVYDEREEIDLPMLHEGRLPEAGSTDEVAVDRLFAEQRNIKVGDTITVCESKLKVTGLISLVDHNALFLSNSDMLMNTSNFGVMVASHDTFKTIKQESITYRYSYRFKSHDNPDAIEKTDSEKLEIATDIQKCLVENGIEVKSILTAEKNQGISFLREDMGHDGPIMNVFIYVLVAIIAFIFAVLTSNTVEQEAAIIGTLRAMGFKKGEIVWHYLVPTIIVALIGSIIGNILGYTAMIPPFKSLYYNSYCLPPLKISFNVGAFLTTTILPVVIMIVINLWMLINKLSLSPLKFLRKDLKKRKQKKAIKLPDFKFLTRFRIRVILQNKGSFLILFIGIFLSSFLLMFGIGLNPLMDHYVDQIDDNLNYEYMYMLKAPVEAEGGEKVFMYSLSTEYYYTEEDIDVSFIGIDADNTTYFSDAGIGSDGNVTDVSITDSFAQKCHISIGDTVLFKDKSKDKEYSLKITAINGYANGLGVYMNRADMCKLFDVDENTFNAYVSDEKLDIDDTFIAKFVTRADMLGVSKQMMSSFGGVIGMVNLFAVFAYMVFMYLLTKIVIEKNALHISFMKVFGYEKREISKLYLDASFIVVMLSLLICLPLEVMAFRECLVYISSLIEGYLEFYLPAYTYVEIVVIGIIAYLLINLLHMRHIKKIPMSEALKSRD